MRSNKSKRSSLENFNKPIFECQKCGQCCKGFGGTLVTEEDILNIADYIKEPVQTVIDKYCTNCGMGLVLAQAENEFCIFWDTICTIHPVKPKLCRDWPFIESVLIDVNNWRMMASTCPGMAKDIPDSIIIDTVKKRLRERS